MFSFDLQRFSVVTQVQGSSKTLIASGDDISLEDRDDYWGFRLLKNNTDYRSAVEYIGANKKYSPLSVNLVNGNISWGSWQSWIMNRFRPCALKYNGTVDYYLDPDDSTKKADGTTSDISDVNYDGNFMVQVSKLYFSCYDEGDYHYCLVADNKLDDSFHCFAHINDNGEEIPYIYLPMFEGSLDSSNRLRSIADATLEVGHTTSDQITYAKNNGPGYYIDEYCNWKLLENLIILMIKSPHCQSVLGRGNMQGGTRIDPGSTKDKGAFWGTDNDNVSAVKTFWIENLWGNRWNKLIGMTAVSTGIYIKPSRPYDALGTVDNAINLGLSLPTAVSGGTYYQKSHVMTPYGLYCIESNGYSESGIPDMLAVAGQRPTIALQGGSSTSLWYAGISAMSIGDKIEYSGSDAGANLTYKPL